MAKIYLPVLRLLQIADILQAVGALTVYAVDTCLMDRPRKWNYRRIYLSDGEWDASAIIDSCDDCSIESSLR